VSKVNFFRISKTQLGKYYNRYLYIVIKVLTIVIVYRRRSYRGDGGGIGFDIILFSMIISTNVVSATTAARFLTILPITIYKITYIFSYYRRYASHITIIDT